MCIRDRYFGKVENVFHELVSPDIHVDICVVPPSEERDYCTPVSYTHLDVYKRQFQGKPVWALNREHLAYLIGYLSADLREKPPGRAKMTQADHLPTFMKTAKNRERIVKLLKKLQEK